MRRCKTEHYKEANQTRDVAGLQQTPRRGVAVGVGVILIITVITHEGSIVTTEGCEF